MVIIRRRGRTGFMLAALCIALAGCATVTPYQPVHDGYGYSEQRIENNRYRVKFAGNSVTPRETVENYLLYRAAELTLQEGFNYFVMTSTDTEADTRYVHTVSAFGSFGHYYYHPFYGLGAGIDSSHPVTQYNAQAFVIMYKGNKPADRPDAFNARQVLDNLQSLIRQPEPS